MLEGPVLQSACRRTALGPDWSDHAEAQPGLSRQDPHLVRRHEGRQEAVAPSPAL